MSKPAVLAFATATAELPKAAQQQLCRHCVTALRPRSATEGENLQAVHADAVWPWRDDPRCRCALRRGPLRPLQDFLFRLRLSECLKQDCMYKDAAHMLAGYKKCVLLLCCCCRCSCCQAFTAFHVCRELVGKELVGTCVEIAQLFLAVSSPSHFAVRLPFAFCCLLPIACCLLLLSSSCVAFPALSPLACSALRTD